MPRVLPLNESAPRIAPPSDEHIFKWDFVDIRPDAIVWVVSNHNPINIAEPLGLYLLLWRSLGRSEEVPFPGTEKSDQHAHSNGSQDITARFTIYVCIFASGVDGGEELQYRRYRLSCLLGHGVAWYSAYFGLKGWGHCQVGRRKLERIG